MEFNHLVTGERGERERVHVGRRPPSYMYTFPKIVNYYIPSSPVLTLKAGNISAVRLFDINAIKWPRKNFVVGPLAS